jgi:hypothetical protein
MRTEELLEQCLQALSTGQELPPEVARYLDRHPDKRAEVEDLLFAANRLSKLPSAELSQPARARMSGRLADKLGVDPALLSTRANAAHEQDPQAELLPYSSNAGRKKLRLSPARLALSRLRSAPQEPQRDSAAEARIRQVFRDLTPDDIRRYIGVRGEEYLYYRQRLPGWEPVFAFIAFVLRGFKRLEKLVTVDDRR